MISCRKVWYSYITTFLPNHMSAKVIKATIKGQVTLPKFWRDQFNTDNYLMLVEKEKLVIKPIKIADIEEDILFDSERDNKGQGIPVNEMIKILKKIQNESD